MGQRDLQSKPRAAGCLSSQSPEQEMEISGPTMVLLPLCLVQKREGIHATRGRSSSSPSFSLIF